MLPLPFRSKLSPDRLGCTAEAPVELGPNRSDRAEPSPASPSDGLWNVDWPEDADRPCGRRMPERGGGLLWL